MLPARRFLPLDRVHPQHPLTSTPEFLSEFSSNNPFPLNALLSCSIRRNAGLGRHNSSGLLHKSQANSFFFSQKGTIENRWPRLILLAILISANRLNEEKLIVRISMGYILV